MKLWNIVPYKQKTVFFFFFLKMQHAVEMITKFKADSKWFK